MDMCDTETHEIFRRLKTSRRCIRQTFGKFDKFHTVATKPGAGCPPKVTNREKNLIKLQQLRDDTGSLADLVRYVNTNLNLSIGRSTISRILQDYSTISYIAARKPRITPTQRRNRLTCCYDHLNWSINDSSNVIFSGESNFEVLNRIYIHRFRNNRTRFERSQKRVHKGGGITYVSRISIYLSNIYTIQNRCNYFENKKYIFFNAIQEEAIILGTLGALNE